MPGHTNRGMIKKAYTILLYLTYIGFIIENIMNIGVSSKETIHLYIMAIPIKDIVLLMMLVVFILNRKLIFSIIRRSYIYFYVLMITIFTVRGIMINGMSSMSFLRADLRIALWLIGGIGFGIILMKTGNVILNLKIIVGITTILLAISTLNTGQYKVLHVSELTEFDRYAETEMYRFANLIFVPLILLFNFEGNKLKNRIVPICCIGSMLYFLVYISNTRSMGITLTVIIAIYVISFGLVKILKNQVNIVRILSITVISIGVIVFVFIRLSSKETRLERLFAISATTLRDDLRFLEWLEFKRDCLESGSVLFGKGLGGTIDSPVDTENPTFSLHVGILNYWMKMGIIPFLLLFVFVFIRIPFQYIRSLLFGKRLPLKKRAAVLIVLPALFPWIIALAISGGYSEISHLSVGLAYLVYGEIKTNGLKGILGQFHAKNRLLEIL